jgi:hypothetical protein
MPVSLEKGKKSARIFPLFKVMPIAFLLRKNGSQAKSVRESCNPVDLQLNEIEEV